MLNRIRFVFLFAVCIGGTSASLNGPERNLCPDLSSIDMDACLISDPCCFVTPKFENGCFTGCMPVCQNSAFCDNKCPILTKFNVESCVNTDGHCFVQEFNEEILGQKCFTGCVKGCE